MITTIERATDLYNRLKKFYKIKRVSRIGEWNESMIWEPNNPTYKTASFEQFCQYKTLILI